MGVTNSYLLIYLKFKIYNFICIVLFVITSPGVVITVEQYGVILGNTSDFVRSDFVGSNLVRIGDLMRNYNYTAHKITKKNSPRMKSLVTIIGCRIIGCQIIPLIVYTYIFI